MTPSAFPRSACRSTSAASHSALIVTAALLALAALRPQRASAQAATITGRVTAQGTDVPLSDSRVVVLGTSLTTTTNADGRYTLRSVPAGTVDVRVLRVGYQEQKRSLTVAAGQAVTADFAMTAAVVNLAEVVTTATGEQRRVEIGNSISTVDAAARTEAAPIPDVATMLIGQAAGVQVLTANTPGVGARVRIRGVSSLSLVNDPIYIVDGVRINSANGSLSGNIFTGGAAQSRADDINPDEIENIEIVKGPSAATLYGTDAANGVIVITTKRGRAGAAQYHVFGESGVTHDFNTYPTAYFLAGKAPGATVEKQCFLTQISAGTCVADSLRSFNLFSDPNTTPLHNGYRQNGGLQVSGGSDAVRYFTSGELDRQTGVVTIPKFDLQRLDTLNIKALDEWVNPNYLGSGTFRANMNAALSPKLDAAVSAGFITSTTRLPQNDNDAYGLGSNAFGGPGFEGSGPGISGISTLGFQLHGYRASTPAESFQETYTQYINRFIGSTNLNWRPTSWLANRADIGIDNIGRQDEALCRSGQCADVGTHRLGYVQDDRTSITTTTANVTSTGSFNPRPWLGAKTTAGAQWVSSDFNRNGAHGENLTPGSTTVNGGASLLADEATTETKTLGLFVEEAVAINDRLFLTGAVRSDQNSAFGTNFQRVFYPKASLSWIVSDQSFFHRPGWLDQLRVRSAYGSSGVQPGPIDALMYFRPVSVNVTAQDQPGVQYYAAGNSDLRPERATEFEGGFDAKLFSNKADLDLTYYSKLTHDALIGTVIPPGLGTGNTTQQTNLGSVKNAGLEATLTTQIIDRRQFGWDLSFNASTNANKLVTLGTDASGTPIPSIVGTTIQERAGYPLFGYWQRKYTYADANGDGIITLNEIHVADSATFIGYSAPRYQASISNGFDLLNRKVRISGLFDYRGGSIQLDGNDRIRCQSRNNCQFASDKSTSLADQAASVAVREDPSHTETGFMYDDSFLRFRELSVLWTLPDRLATRFPGAHAASLLFAARNLHVWTKYKGMDPENNSDVGSTSSVGSDFQTMPPPTYFSLRLNVNF